MPPGTPPDAAARGAALVRLASARAILRLVRSPLDARVPAGAYLGMALTVQDPEIDVRAGFTEALVGALARACRSAGAGARSAKLAAPLALAAVDPSKPARARAALALARYVATRRTVAAGAARARALKAAAAAGGRGGAGGGPPTTTTVTTAIHEGPEFLLPYLAQVLAHHPDLPPVPGLEGGVARLDAAGRAALPTPADVAPFCAMLQFALDPLVALAPPPGMPPGAPLHALSKILRAVRAAEDGTPEPAGGALALLADTGLALARALAAAHGRAGLLGAEASAAAAADRVPGGVPLPRSLYRAPDPPRPRLADGACLVPGWAPALVPELMSAAAGAAPGAPAAGGPKRARAAGGGAPKGAAAKPPASAKPPAPKKAKPGPAPPKSQKERKAALTLLAEDSEGEEGRAGRGSPSDEEEVVRPPAPRRPPVEPMELDLAGKMAAAKRRAGSLAASSSSEGGAVEENTARRASGGRRAGKAAAAAAAALAGAGRPARPLRSRQQ